MTSWQLRRSWYYTRRCYAPTARRARSLVKGVLSRLASHPSIVANTPHKEPISTRLQNGRRLEQVRLDCVAAWPGDLPSITLPPRDLALDCLSRARVQPWLNKKFDGQLGRPRRS